MIAIPRAKQKPCVGLIAMPWYSVWVPSVQLGVLRRCLHDLTQVDSYELYVDYAAMISTQLYDRLSGGGEFVEEWLFAQHYFRGEGLPYNDDVASCDFPSIGIGNPQQEKQVLKVLAEVTGDYLIKMRDMIDWGKYDVIGFTLGIAQTSASMALAALIRRKFPHVRIVFGGSACLGSQAEAILSMCPHIDVIVRGEAEGIVSRLIERLAEGNCVNDLPGLTFRDAGGVISDSGSRVVEKIFEPTAEPNYDEYIERMTRYHLRDDTKIMLPFESSRGCWWGEKTQCTFCGLADNMRYRARNSEAVLSEIDSLYERYGIRQFFATDLIMPQEYYTTLLPRVRASGRKYHFYYELKSNLRREQVGLLSGLVHIQPGLESLSTHVLKLMKKGLTACQNIQFLKWCAEYKIKIFSWHLIVGMPGENAEENVRMAALVPMLHHLPPPKFAFFELHRFSPIHENPSAFGLSNVRPARHYSRVFPISEEMLAKFVYRFEYDSDSFGGRTPPWMEADAAEYYAQELQAAIEVWQEAYASGEQFFIEPTANGAILRDTRTYASFRINELNVAEARLFEFLDSVRSRPYIVKQSASKYRSEVLQLGGEGRVESLLDEWEKRGWVFRDDNHVVALAVHNVPRPIQLSETPLLLGIDRKSEGIE